MSDHTKRDNGAEGLSALHEETVRDIEEDILEHEGSGEFSKFKFFFAPPVDGSYDFWERMALGKERVTELDPAVERAVGIFKNLGCDVDYGDTVPFSFSLNRCWYSAAYDRCIRSFGYTLPVSEDVDALARLVDDVGKGRLLMLAFEED